MARHHRGEPSGLKLVTAVSKGDCGVQPPQFHRTMYRMRGKGYAEAKATGSSRVSRGSYFCHIDDYRNCFPGSPTHKVTSKNLPKGSRYGGTGL